MREHILFFDTETSGIPDSLNAPLSASGSWPFVLQVAWFVYESSGELVKSENHFIFEKEVYINEASIKIHGITREELISKGKSRKEVMKLFARDLRQYKPLLVGHFVEFDSKILQVAFHRSGLKNIVRNYPVFCTMLATSEYSRIPGHNYPKLEDLYYRLFGEKLERPHDALEDARATARCFFELLKRGDINKDLNSETSTFREIDKRIRNKTGCGLPVLIIFLVVILMAL